MNSTWADIEPTRAEIDATAGPLVLEFGTPNCGFCRAARPSIEQALQEFPKVRHVKVVDGPGRPLGRSFGVKLWPTLVLLNNGRAVARIVRPVDASGLRDALARIAAPA